MPSYILLLTKAQDWTISVHHVRAEGLVLELRVADPFGVSRKAPLHAHEPREKKIGGASEQLAVEQFFVLRGKRFWPDRQRSHPLTQFVKIKPKAPAFKNRRLGHPQVQNLSKPGPRAKICVSSTGLTLRPSLAIPAVLPRR
jgi:hypothetical protein